VVKVNEAIDGDASVAFVVPTLTVVVPGGWLARRTVIVVLAPSPTTIDVFDAVIEFSVNAAFTLAAAVIDTVQVPVPVQAPLQPLKVEPADGDAVSVTLVP